MTTLATDNFSRANGGLGANWTTLYSKTALAIVSDAVQLSSEAADGGDYYSAISWPNAQWCQLQVNVLNYADCSIALAIRTATGAATWYAAFIGGPLGASATFAVIKYVAGVKTTLKAGTTITVSANDVFYFGAQGTVLTLQQNGATIWTSTDSSIASGNVAFYIPNNSRTVSDAIVGPWSGGDFVGANPITLIGASGSTGIAQLGAGTNQLVGASGSTGVASLSGSHLLGAGSGSLGVANISSLGSGSAFAAGDAGSMGVAFLESLGPLAPGNGVIAPPRLSSVFDTRSFILQQRQRNFTVSAMQTFPTKDPAESLDLTFDFSTNLPAGVSLNGVIVVTVSVLEGTDGSPSAIINGAPAVDATGARVVQPVKGGYSGVLYEVKVQASTTLPSIILVLAGALPVRSAQ